MIDYLFMITTEQKTKFKINLLKKLFKNLKICMLDKGFGKRETAISCVRWGMEYFKHVTINKIEKVEKLESFKESHLCMLRKKWEWGEELSAGRILIKFKKNGNLLKRGKFAPMVLRSWCCKISFIYF